jgi:hypothetical protein
MFPATTPKNRTAFHLLLVAVIFTCSCRLFIPQQRLTPDVQEIVLTPTPAAPEDTGKTELEATPTQKTTGFKAGAPLRFASYSEPAAQTGGTLPTYRVESGLSNVHTPFLLSEAQVARLERDGFVVTPGDVKEFFTIYEQARYANVPIFVTSDSLLHTYHLMFDKVLRTAEREYFIPLLRDLNAVMLATTDAQYQALQNSDWAEAALRSVAYFAVASKLLDASVQAPPYAADLVAQELALIEATSGITSSPIFPYLKDGEDYTQYIPRGHYTLSEELKAYFKSMMWYGRMTFRLKGPTPEAGLLETRMALLVVQALNTSRVRERMAFEAWADLYEPTAFFVGRSDDLTVIQYQEVMKEVYGAAPMLDDLLDEQLFSAFLAQAELLAPPLILGMVIEDTDDVDQMTKGMRFMGQRFVPDAYIFRQLIYRNVGTLEDPRMLPKGLDLLAAMGSETAYQALDEMGETRYENYIPQMNKVKGWLSGLTQQDWTETLYNAWLYNFFPLIDKPTQGLPLFMQSKAWEYKQMNTVLGSWTELKHDTLLYAKQVYAELGGGPPAPDPIPPRGYVEPVPVFFARLAALTEMTRSGLDRRNVLSDEDRDNLQRIVKLSLSLQAVAEKELRGEPLNEQEFELILFYGGELEHIVMASADSDVEDPFAPKFMDEAPQAAVVADVATDPNGQVLQEGIGRVDEIHVIVPLVLEDGSLFLQVAKGGVFSYYEFAWPINDRLTDEKWRLMLEEGSVPDRPAWSSQYMVQQGEYSQLLEAITRTHSEITNAYWNVGWMILESGDPLLTFADELGALRENRQYVGHQLASFDVKSYDLQSDTKAVVVIQETWQDTLYAGEYPDYGVDPLAERGPYLLLATYTLEWTFSEWGDYWKVVNVAVKGAAPGWR